MLNEIIKITVGALLHDIGKVIQRAGETTGTHSRVGVEYLRTLGFIDKDILDCVQYHHGRELSGAKDVSEYAYITYIADNISAATDRRAANDETAEFGWDHKTPLQSVFNLLKYESECHYFRPVTLDEQDGINFPQKSTPLFDEYFYHRITDRLSDSLKDFVLSDVYINSLLELTEATLSFVPSSTKKNEVADISLYDHMKLTAAIAGCIYQFMQEEGEIDYRSILLERTEEFYKKDFAIVYSADISGIQNFIYTIHSDGALKSLRGRSFYLELFAENLIDELLTGVGFTRANLLYSGGGHFYMLLPNTQNVKLKLSEIIQQTNTWLLERFRAALYIADGYSVCSANNLKNIPPGAYGDIFKEVSRMISAKKLHRYSASEILGLNNQHVDGRECRICKAVRTLENDECDLCSSLIKLSSSVSKQYNNEDKDRNDDLFYVVTRNAEKDSVPVSATQYAVPITKKELIGKLASDREILRYYGKNTFYMGKNLATKLWVGDYCMEKEVSEYAKRSAGIDRIGILRMDVDDLGNAFTSGFAYNDGKFNTLSRTASFSRHLSMFFKRDLNTLLNRSTRDITIVYSGGDDMFLLGGWDDIIESAVEIRKAFYDYTQGKLSISAGVGMYPGKYPIHVMARETGELENYAKGKREGGVAKNAVTLFTPELCFSWDELADCVISEKLTTLNSFFSENKEKGNSFLYKIMEFIQGIEDEENNGLAKISLARYAYLLAKAESESDDPDIKQKYKTFSKSMYSWISHTKERKQLKAAIYLYIYSKRGES